MCPKCEASFRDGRWQWAPAVADAHESVCPACQRSADGLPAGILTLSGEFHLEHRAEILGLIRHTEERENKQHPLKRIMQIDESEDALEVATCDASLARALGDAIHHAYAGELDYHYPDGAGVLRVHWKR